MNSQHLLTGALGFGFAAYLALNWQAIMQVQMIRLVDAGTSAFFCF